MESSKRRLPRWLTGLPVMVALSLPALAAPPAGAGSTEPNGEVARAREILREIDDMWRGRSSHARLTMEVKTRHYTRSMELEAWSLGKEMTLVRILSPLKEKGTATLKSGTHLYSYLPRTDRTIRMTSGMMGGSWMGSHFTNDDLVKESRLEEDYIPRISFEGLRDGRDIIEFTLTPKPDAPVVWGRLVTIVSRKGYIPIIETYYDEDLKVARTLRFSAVEKLAGRLRPTIMEVVPADKPDEYTRITYSRLELNITIQESFFSLASLRRGGF